MIIVLMGYMGSGKSTIGKELATVLNYEFIDLDNYIESKEGFSITELFNTKGEIYFRKTETLYLNELLNTKNNLILALGGGTPCYGKNIELLRTNLNVKLFYLKLSIGSLAERLFKDKLERPLISHIDTIEQLTEFIGKHLFERASYYNQADIIITSDHLTSKEIIDKIRRQLV